MIEESEQAIEKGKVYSTKQVDEMISPEKLKMKKYYKGVITMQRH
jgi:hypothetical protein